MDKPLKALLVGSSFSAAPVFFALKKYGLHVSVCGKIESDPCHQYADASYFIDYSRTDDLMQLVESNEFDFLVPTCNDYSYMSCAPVAEKHGFPGFDSVKVATILHTKSEFRQVSKRHAIPAPLFEILEEGQSIDSADLHFPVLVKPIDSFSGRGMSKVAAPADLSQAVRDAFKVSRSSRIVIEEFLSGNLHSHSAFIQDRQIAFDFFVDEFCTVYPYQVNCSNHPSVLSTTIRDAVRKTISELVDILGLSDGLLHTQFIADKNNHWIIECMRRCPGDNYGHLIGLSTGIDYADFFVRPFLKRRLPTEQIKTTSKYYGRHTISVDRPLVNLSFSHNIPSETLDIVPLKSSGEQLDVAPFDKLAILFVEFKDEATMLGTTPRFADFVRINELGSNDRDRCQ